MELTVTYRTPLDGELRACMMKCLVKYLIFMRGQIPCLYDELLQFVEKYRQQQGEGSRRRLPTSGGIKKAIKCVEAMELLFGVQLDAIFSLKVQKAAVALIFGSSMMSPREAVVVDFEVASEDTESLSQSTTASSDTDQEDMSLDDSQTLTPPSPPMTREKLMRLCTQKLMRDVFTHAVEQFSSALPATKLHIAVLAERHATRIPGFLPKQQFKLRLPKDKRGGRSHYVTIFSGVNSTNSQQSSADQTTNHKSINMENNSPIQSGVNRGLTSPTASSASDMMWYVLEKPIPGFSDVISTIEG
ncbi:hypothetical protein PHMEG_00020811 [Phytophthora megakarya]|uniref:Uncharacterized protein n=1 Tax=Phytophthora megakarya TaxID=4795 RepID=A0A225VMY5_9STRA|nr:hypothetical protein PHMEG_00020811 [Phytophthora megakarya]